MCPDSARTHQGMARTWILHLKISLSVTQYGYVANFEISGTRDKHNNSMRMKELTVKGSSSMKL